MNTNISWAMSAFALRKRLLNQQTTPILAKEEGTENTNLTPHLTNAVETNKSQSPKKARKGPNTKSASTYEELHAVPKLFPSGAPSENDHTDAHINHNSTLSRSSSPSISSDEDSVGPAKALPVQLSNFTPTKSNFQKRKDGRLILNLSEGEVCEICS